MENKIKQLRKGILELAILGALDRKSHYGYSLIKHLTGGNGVELTEGTIYPILSRLAKEGLISAEWVESRQGPPRKYYALTDDGREAHRVLEEEFNLLRDLVARASSDPDDADERATHSQIEISKETNDDQ
jgi:PadR family transcriptional regulator PadR